jgi:hypothetical protein
MKNNLIALGAAALSALLLSSFVSKENDDDQQKPKTERHVRIVKMKDGKKMELDTVFTGNDVFIWNGDTINPPRHFRGGMREPGRFRGPRPGGDMDIFITRKHKGAPGTPETWMISPRHEMDIFKGGNDSLDRKIIIRKFERRGAPGHAEIWRGAGRIPNPPAPPAIGSMQHQTSGNVIDLNDPGIISFKKKGMSGGREKIEIIRKKGSEDHADALGFGFNSGYFMAHDMPGMMENFEFDMDMKHDTLDVEHSAVVKEIDKKVEENKK